MAKPRSNQLFPSVGVLVAAILAAFFAVVLVNVYVKSKTAQWKNCKRQLWKRKSAALPFPDTVDRI